MTTNNEVIVRGIPWDEILLEFHINWAWWNHGSLFIGWVFLCQRCLDKIFSTSQHLWSPSFMWKPTVYLAYGFKSLIVKPGANSCLSFSFSLPSMSRTQTQERCFCCIFPEIGIYKTLCMSTCRCWSNSSPAILVLRVRQWHVTCLVGPCNMAQYTP